MDRYSFGVELFHPLLQAGLSRRTPFALLIPLAGPGMRLGLVTLAGIVIGAGVVAGNVIIGSFRQSYTPHHLIGRVTVSMRFLNYGTIPLGALIGGALGESVGLRPAIWIMTTAVAVAPLLLLLGPIHRHRDLPTAETETTTSTINRRQTT